MLKITWFWCGILFCAAFLAAGIARAASLQNEHLRVMISPGGNLQQVDNLIAGETYPIEADSFTLASGRGSLSNRGTAPLRVATDGESARFIFSLPDQGTAALEYRLRPGCAYCERWLTITNGSERLLLERLDLGRTVFATAPREAIQYDTFWHAPTASFLRWERGGLFTGIENPFFETSLNGREAAFSFAPAMWIAPGEIYQSEPQFLGVYRRSGRMLADHPPRTVASTGEGENRPRFRNPAGQVPLDWNEIQGMRQFAADYLAPRQDRFLSILYMYWYPIAQLPVQPEAEMQYRRVLDTFRALGGDLVVFNPLVRYDRPAADAASFWNLAPEGSTAQHILQYAGEKGLKYGFYMGVAAQGDRGNACNLPFAPEKPEWKRIGPLGGISSENCLACEGFANWWHAVQRNTIARHKLQFWSWDPGPGHGFFCYSDQHGHVPGKGGYLGWRKSIELLRKLRGEFPNLYLMAYYGRKEYGLWGFKYFDQQESYWEQTIFYGATIHPDLHDDRVNADGARLQNWWNSNFRFLPSVMNHALTHRIGENSYDPRLPKVWDHGGWRYSLLSGLAAAGSVTACILPEDVALVPGMKEFYNRWLDWARKNFDLVKYNLALGDQVQPGGIDAWARVKGGHGFLFLCNPAPRPARKELCLDDQIGLRQPGQYTLRELNPRDGAAWVDPVSQRSVFQAGERITFEVPAYEVLLLELAPATPGEADSGISAAPVVLPAPGPVRMLDDWQMPDGQRFSFPFHAGQEQLSLRTSFAADPAIREALERAVPSNLVEIAPLVEQWRKDRQLPHNFAWARPDRLWLVLPFADASRVREVRLECGSAEVPVACFSVSGVKIIFYADLSGVVKWGQTNTLSLHLAGLQPDQFLGPYLDYPAILPAETQQSGLPAGPRVVFDRPVESEVAAQRAASAPVGKGLPKVLRAAMDPPLLGGNREVTFTATVDMPAEQLRGVYLSAGWLGSDVRMACEAGSREWKFRCGAPGRFPILDAHTAHVWAVGANGQIGAVRTLPVKWSLGGFLPEGAATALAGPWPEARADALAALEFCEDPRVAGVVRDRLANTKDPEERRRLESIARRLCATIGDKTLVAWVCPSNLTQRGGSVLTIEKLADQGTPDFDAIVFGEITPGKWMPGSGAFRRTMRDQSAWPVETADSRTLVQVAIVYRGGQLTLFRDGRICARYPVQPTSFGPSSLILIGRRHLEASGACWFAGAVEEARLYDSALEDADVAALRLDDPGRVKPFARWTFENGTQDAMGRLPPGVLHGHAKVSDGKLHLDGVDSCLLIRGLDGG